MVRCSDGTYYVGVTNNIEARVYQHNAGTSPESYTRTRRPVSLVYASLYFDIEQAIWFEKQLKGWGRAKKEALIAGDWSAIRELSKSKNHAHPSTRSG